MKLAIVSFIWIGLITFVLNKYGKEKDDMAVIYATLIVKGTKTIDQVPPVIKSQVKQILIDLDLPELAEEND